MPRPDFSKSVVAVSFSSAAMFWLTADGVYPRRAAAAVIEPVWTTAHTAWRRRGSSTC